MRTLRCMLLLVLLPATAMALPGGRPMYEKSFIQPHVQSITFEGGDVVLDARWRLANGDLAGSWIFDPDTDHAVLARRAREEGLDIAEPPSRCTPLPAAAVPSPSMRDYLEVRAAACDGDRWLLLEEGYCPEGLAQSGTAWLASAGGDRRELEGAIPRCHSPVTAVLDESVAWIGTERPIEKYDSIDGAVIEVPLESDAPHDRHLEGHVVTGMALQPGTPYLWVASRSGVHRFNRESREWRHGYFRYRLADENKVALYLADQPLSSADYDLWDALLSLPILDRKAFEKSWQAMKPDVPWYGNGNSPELWPHYRDSLLALAQSQSRHDRARCPHTFSALLSLVLDVPHASKAARAAIARNLLDMSLAPSCRRPLAGHLREVSYPPDRLQPADLLAVGIDVEEIALERQFYELLRKASALRPDESLREMCRLVEEHAFIATIAAGAAASMHRERELEACAPVPEKTAKTPAPRRGEPALLKAECHAYEIPPGMSRQEFVRRMQAAASEGGEPEGIRRVPCARQNR